LIKLGGGKGLMLWVKRDEGPAANLGEGDPNGTKA